MKEKATLSEILERSENIDRDVPMEVKIGLITDQPFDAMYEILLDLQYALPDEESEIVRAREALEDIAIQFLRDHGQDVYAFAELRSLRDTDFYRVEKEH